jgi:crotonobetainyl-CoA:carnitine CoA-transferase CaiB-like acyl-CoA transferase
VKHNVLVDATLQEAIGARTLAETVRLFEENDLTASPVYDIADISRDPHVAARRILIEVPDPKLGAVRMTAPTPRMSATPAEVRWAGPELGAHNGEVFGALGIDDRALEELQRDGIV